MSIELPARDENETSAEAGGVARRTVLRVGAVGTVGVGLATAQGLVVPALQQKGLLSADGVFAASATAIGDLLLYIEAFPTSPLILDAVHGRAAGPEGARAGADVGLQQLGAAAGTRARASRTRWATSSTRSGATEIGSPDPIVYKIDLLVATHSLHHLAGAADRHERASRPSRSTPPARPTPPARSAYAAAEHDLRVQRHLPRPDDQRRVRQAGAGPLRQPPRREPATTSTGRTSAPRTGRS